MQTGAPVNAMQLAQVWTIFWSVYTGSFERNQLLIISNLCNLYSAVSCMSMASQHLMNRKFIHLFSQSLLHFIDTS